jgi:hypothetical protein
MTGRLKQILEQVSPYIPRLFTYREVCRLVDEAFVAGCRSERLRQRLDGVGHADR